MRGIEDGHARGCAVSGEAGPHRRLHRYNVGAQAVLERHGGKNQRLWQGIAGPGGAVFETFAWVIEFDSWADYGMYLDAVLADEDFQAGAGKLFGADAPATQTASSIENEIEI